jgi:clan AA aspartic protease
MISGTVTAEFTAIIRLIVIGPSGQSDEIEALVDTGFTGFLTLPPSLTTLLGLTFQSLEDAVLADGGSIKLPVYGAKIRWDGSVRDILAMETGGDPLVGMALLEGYRLTLDAIDGGPVLIEALG